MFSLLCECSTILCLLHCYTLKIDVNAIFTLEYDIETKRTLLSVSFIHVAGCANSGIRIFAWLLCIGLWMCNIWAFKHDANVHKIRQVSKLPACLRHPVHLSMTYTYASHCRRLKYSISFKFLHFIWCNCSCCTLFGIQEKKIDNRKFTINFFKFLCYLNKPIEGNAMVTQKCKKTVNLRYNYNRKKRCITVVNLRSAYAATLQSLAYIYGILRQMARMWHIWARYGPILA